MIFRFQRRTDLALSALNQLGSAPGGRLTGTELASAVGTSATFLPQVMAPLIRAGWVTSERGPGGGYALTEESADATLLDVIEMTEGRALQGRCVMRDAPCPGDHTCPVHAVTSMARDVLVEGFKNTSAVATTRGAAR